MFRPEGLTKAQPLSGASQRLALIRRADATSGVFRVSGVLKTLCRCRRSMPSSMGQVDLRYMGLAGSVCPEQRLSASNP